MNRAGLKTGPIGPVFFLLLLAGGVLPACTPRATQVPTINLEQVHDSGAHRIAFDAGSQRLASGGLRGAVRLWSVVDGTELHAYRVHHKRITGLAWLGDSQLLSSDLSGRIVIYDLVDNKITRAVEHDRIQDLRVSPGHDWLVMVDEKHIRRLSLPLLETVQQRALASAPSALAIDPQSGRIAVADNDGRVRLLSPDLEPLRELTRPSRVVHDLAFSPDGETLLGGGWFKLLAWHTPSGQLEEFPTEHLGKISAVAVSPDGEYWLSLGRETDSNFLMMRAANREIVRRFDAMPLCGQQTRFSPDGRYAASASDDGSVHIHDLQAPYRPRVPYLEYD